MNIAAIRERIARGGAITNEESLEISAIGGAQVFEFFTQASYLREHFRGNKIDLCAIVNAKSGACPEDCSYCAQSAKARSDVSTYPLISQESILKAAKSAKSSGAKRFCIVTSGRKPGPSELKRIASAISKIRKLGLLPCATLGLLDLNELQALKDAGLERFHHNLETSEKFFPSICHTHSYADKLNTIEAVRKAGLSLCSGGIFGLGESWQDRVEMAFLLKKINADSIPMNFLIPVKGTKLEKRKILAPFEALKIISLYRFILPEKEVRVCGGRLQTLGEFNSFAIMAGADGLLTGDYLTRKGIRPEADMELIRGYGLRAG